MRRWKLNAEDTIPRLERQVSFPYAKLSWLVLLFQQCAMQARIVNDHKEARQKKKDTCSEMSRYKQLYEALTSEEQRDATEILRLRDEAMKQKPTMEPLEIKSHGLKNKSTPAHTLDEGQVGKPAAVAVGRDGAPQNALLLKADLRKAKKMKKVLKAKLQKLLMAKGSADALAAKVECEKVRLEEENATQKTELERRATELMRKELELEDHKSKPTNPNAELQAEHAELQAQHEKLKGRCDGLYNEGKTLEAAYHTLLHENQELKQHKAELSMQNEALQSQTAQPNKWTIEVGKKILTLGELVQAFMASNQELEKRGELMKAWESDRDRLIVLRETAKGIGAKRRKLARMVERNETTVSTLKRKAALLWNCGIPEAADSKADF